MCQDDVTAEQGECLVEDRSNPNGLAREEEIGRVEHADPQEAVVLGHDTMPGWGLTPVICSPARHGFGYRLTPLR
ncbi:MAG: hypothetical protein WKF75_10690 [Singulisphaera sp.]